jgi:hypothetical protein
VHAVATPESVEAISGPAVVLGGFGFRRSTMEDHLTHGIRYAIWHEDWSNDQHDDFVIVIARMLKWQCLSQQERPFHGRNLYALIMMGAINLLLDGLSYDQDSQCTELMLKHPVWRNPAGGIAMDLALEVYRLLSDAEQKEFHAFRQHFINMFTYQMKCHRNLSN